MYDLFLALIAFFSQYENSVRKERQKIGIEAAKRAGKYGGRPSKLTKERLDEIQELHEKGYTKSQIAKFTQVSRATVYRAFSLIETRKKKMIQSN